MPTIPPNPYEPPTGIETEPVRTPGYIRIAAGPAVFLIGLGVFGAGVVGTLLTMQSIVSNSARHLWPNMIAVSSLYLGFGLSFFAASQCLLARRTRLGLFFFFAPVAVFGTLLAIFGV